MPFPFSDLMALLSRKNFATWFYQALASLAMLATIGGLLCGVTPVEMLAQWYSALPLPWGDGGFEGAIELFSSLNGSAMGLILFGTTATVAVIDSTKVWTPRIAVDRSGATALLLAAIDCQVHGGAFPLLTVGAILGVGLLSLAANRLNLPGAEFLESPGSGFRLAFEAAMTLLLFPLALLGWLTGGPRTPEVPGTATHPIYVINKETTAKNRSEVNPTGSVTARAREDE